MVRINWIHMICGSGDPSFNVMLCFVLIVLSLHFYSTGCHGEDQLYAHDVDQVIRHCVLFYCFNTSLFHSTGCHGEDQLDSHDMLIR